MRMVVMVMKMIMMMMMTLMVMFMLFTIMMRIIIIIMTDMKNKDFHYDRGDGNDLYNDVMMSIIGLEWNRDAKMNTKQIHQKQ